RAIATAVKYGIYELIEECILTYPGIIWYRFEGFNLFHLAIKERQVQVFNLVYQMSSYKTFAASELHEEEQENALRIAAKLAQPHRLNIVTGAALQMKCELRWIKACYNNPSCLPFLLSPGSDLSDGIRELKNEQQLANFVAAALGNGGHIDVYVEHHGYDIHDWFSKDN
ncbi:hypothetical protein Tco_0913083, partial [Tanacetum coccineum]